MEGSNDPGYHVRFRTTSETHMVVLLKDPHGNVRARFTAPVSDEAVLRTVYGLGDGASFFRLYDRLEGWGLFASDLDDVQIDLEVRSPEDSKGQPRYSLEAMLSEAVHRLLESGWVLGPEETSTTTP